MVCTYEVQQGLVTYQRRYNCDVLMHFVWFRQTISLHLDRVLGIIN